MLWGNSVSLSENLKVAGWKPMGGGTSAPVKKLNTVERLTSASSSAAIWKHFNIHHMAFSHKLNL